MYTIFYRLYFRIHQKGLENQLFNKIIVKIVNRICNIWLNFITVFYFKINCRNNAGVNTRKRKKKIIASLTTFPERINTVWITIETIMRQSEKADEIILWLAKSQFEDSNELPIKLKNMMKRGLKIKFCDDIRSHKKYYYSMKEYPEDIIITFDDDFFYSYDTIEKLMREHEKFPENIICSSASKITRDDILNPINWKPAKKLTENSNTLGINSGSGTLFPPHSLHPNLFDKDTFMSIAFNTDDLWLTAMAYMNGTKLNVLSYQPFPITVKSTQSNALTKTNNCLESIDINNNAQWNKIIETYGQEMETWYTSIRLDGERGQ